MGGEACARVKPAASMVAVQATFAGVNIFYKLALNDGMNMRVLVAYRNLVAASFLCPLAFFVERKRRPRLTWRILVQGFFCGLLGVTMSQNLYILALKLTSPTFASAMSNLIPAITFIFAVLFRSETMGIRTVSGWAKMIGSLIGLGGAMLLTFYKGSEVTLWSSNVNLLKDHQSQGNNEALFHQKSSNHIMGSLSAIGSCLTYSLWLVIQARMSDSYPCHYSCTALMSFMASIQCTIFSLCVERNWNDWRLGFDIRLLTLVYSGILASGVIYIIMSWCLQKKGPLYVSAFSPLMLVIVAILSSFLLKEKLHVGNIIGAALIVVGLYVVLWGKGREAKKQSETTVVHSSTKFCSADRFNSRGAQNKDTEDTNATKLQLVADERI